MVIIIYAKKIEICIVYKIYHMLYIILIMANIDVLNSIHDLDRQCQYSLKTGNTCYVLNEISNIKPTNNPEYVFAKYLDVDVIVSVVNNYINVSELCFHNKILKYIVFDS